MGERISTKRTGTRASGRIPEFASRAEEAEWWDTHSITDHRDELEPVRVHFATNLATPLAVRLSREDRAEVTRRAREQGIGPSTLVRMWARERLKHETERRSR